MWFGSRNGLNRFDGNSFLSKLKKAAELLAEGDLKINEVANMVGYTLPKLLQRFSKTI